MSTIESPCTKKIKEARDFLLTVDSQKYQNVSELLDFIEPFCFNKLRTTINTILWNYVDIFKLLQFKKDLKESYPNPNPNGEKLNIEQFC